MFLPNIIKIDPYNFELCRFKFVHFLRQMCSLIFRKKISLRQHGFFVIVVIVVMLSVRL